MKERIVGHRGYGVLAPENTLIALQKSKELGLSHVEYDVRLTKDGVAVISHDDNLIRCAHKDILISQSNYADIKDINVAKHFALEDLHATIPTFEDYLEESARLGLRCQIEFKPAPGDEDRTVKTAAAIMDDFYADTPDEELPLVTSFIPECLKALKGYSNRPYETGILVKVEETTRWETYAQTAQCDYIHLHALYLTKEIAKDITEKGYKINGFHLNHPVLAEKAMALGCNRFTCDIPDVFLRLKK